MLDINFDYDSSNAVYTETANYIHEINTDNHTNIELTTLTLANTSTTTVTNNDNLNTTDFSEVEGNSLQKESISSKVSQDNNNSLNQNEAIITVQPTANSYNKHNNQQKKTITAQPQKKTYKRL